MGSRAVQVPKDSLPINSPELSPRPLGVFNLGAECFFSKYTEVQQQFFSSTRPIAWCASRTGAEHLKFLTGANRR